MLRLWDSLTLCALAWLLAGAAPLPEYGPAPTWRRAIDLSEDYIRSLLDDPDSARFEWPNQVTRGTLKMPFEKTRNGYYTCGFVNSKNHFGGYSGRVWVIALVRDDQAVFAELGQRNGIDMVTAMCERALKTGSIHRVADGPGEGLIGPNPAR